MVGASEAGPVVVDGMGIGANAGSVAEAGGGLTADAPGGGDDQRGGRTRVLHMS